MNQDKLLCSFRLGCERCRNTHLDSVTLGMYVDGELSAERIAAVEAHLETCVSCRGEVQSLFALGEEFRQIPSPTWDIKAMVGQVMLKLESAEAVSLSGSVAARGGGPTRVQRRSVLSLAFAALAIVLIVASITSSAFKHQFVREQEKILVRSHYMVSSSHVGGVFLQNPAGPVQMSRFGHQLLQGWR